MHDLPSGTVTLLFTDIEGSTQLVQQLDARYGAVLAEYRTVLRHAFSTAEGEEVDTQGDSFLIAFARADAAVQAAVAVQRELAAHHWPDDVLLPTRIGIHTGAPRRTEEGYVGLDVHRAARVAAAAHGGQVLLTEAVTALVRQDLPPDITLQDLGQRRLKDLRAMEHIYQLCIAGLPADFPPIRALDARPNNLPPQPTPLVGRDREAQAVRDLKRDPRVRLLTLTGPGGAGKTRLALEVAASLLDQFADGVWFVALEGAQDPASVAPWIAATLGVRELANQTPVQRLAAHLANRHLLLVLDNFEQVVAAGPLLTELLRAAPGLSLLITSRTILHIYGEHEYPVAPLALPPTDEPLPPEQLSQYAAVQLFIQRAQAVRPDFTVTEDNAPAVAAICIRLDGLPLAIELAAARIRFFGPHSLLHRLARCLDMLTGGPHDRPTRQQTLRGAIDWSYSLLQPGEQRLLARLAVFAGGWTVEAAEAVCGGPDAEMDVVDGLQSLAEKSLVRDMPGAGDEPRLTMLQTVHAYALERLEQSGEVERLRAAHADFYCAVAEAAAPELAQQNQRLWAARLELERENMSAALAWSLERGEPARALTICASLLWFWMARGYYDEGCAWTERALALPASASLPRARALLAGALLHWEQGAAAHAVDLLHEARDLSRRLGDRSVLAWSLTYLGRAARTAGAYEDAVALADEALSLQRAEQDLDGICQNLLSLGDVALDQGDLDRARTWLEEALVTARAAQNQAQIAWALHLLGRATYAGGDYAAARELFNRGLAMFREWGWQLSCAEALLDLGHVARREGDLPTAWRRYRESLARYHAHHTHNVHAAECLEGLAALCLTREQPTRAARLLGAAAAVREALHAPVAPAQRADYDRLVNGAQAGSEADAWSAAWAEGYALGPDAALTGELGDAGA